jgi:DNA uptake protein ComE-like DNA-binding protein
MPGMTPATAKALVAARPFDSITALNTFLLAQKLTQDQANALYRQMFVHINLNTATATEIMLIPGAGKRMAHEFEEYRPWRSYAQFEKEIGKYVDAKEVARLAQYTFIPLNLNTSTEADFMTIPGVGKRMAHEFEEYRPWRSYAQFEKEIGKYVDAKEVARLAQYTFIPLNLNTSTEADFMTIPGVGKRMAHEFDEYRPWKTQAQFEKEIGKYVDAKEVKRLWRYVYIP